jgi:peptide/nickel transport system permease protein
VGIYIIRRALAGAVTLLAISLIVFLLVRATGNPVDLYMDPTATEKDRALLTAALGLDQPLHVQYYVFLTGALHGDLGRSISINRPVLEVFLERFGNTLQLTGLAFGLSLAIALPVGALAAVTRGKWWDWLTRGLVFLGHALPSFWLGVMLMLVFAVQLRWVPPAGKGDLATFVLPVITIAWGSAAGVTRMMRSSMLEVLPADYIRTAYAKGLAPLAVLWAHALKNAMIPVVGYVSVVVLRNLVLGMIVVETVFAWPGVGRLAYQAALSRDFPLVQGIVLMIALIVILATLLADILYGWLDPRIRYS